MAGSREKCFNLSRRKKMAGESCIIGRHTEGENVYGGPIDEEKYGIYQANYNGVDQRWDETFKFNTRIGTPEHPAEPGRYHVYLNYVCPWAHRVQIIIDYLGLSDVVSYSYTDPLRDARGWAFRERTGPDPINGFRFLKDAYRATDPSFTGVASVPAVWDIKTHELINNNYESTIVDFSTKFRQYAKNDADLYPEEQRDEINKLYWWLAENINEGVYGPAEAATQEEYDKAENKLWDAVYKLEDRLRDRRYLFGDNLTLDDIVLWVTLARFDLTYTTLFRSYRHRLVDFPNLWAYARDLYSNPAFSKGCRWEYIKETYYTNFQYLLYNKIIPQTPVINWEEPQDRAKLSH